jgi:hypothetical protein
MRSSCCVSHIDRLESGPDSPKLARASSGSKSLLAPRSSSSSERSSGPCSGSIGRCSTTDACPRSRLCRSDAGSAAIVAGSPAPLAIFATPSGLAPATTPSAPSAANSHRSSENPSFSRSASTCGIPLAARCSAEPPAIVSLLIFSFEPATPGIVFGTDAENIEPSSTSPATPPLSRSPSRTCSAGGKLEPATSSSPVKSSATPLTISGRSAAFTCAWITSELPRAHTKPVPGCTKRSSSGLPVINAPRAAANASSPAGIPTWKPSSPPLIVSAALTCSSPRTSATACAPSRSTLGSAPVSAARSPAACPPGW